MLVSLFAFDKVQYLFHQDREPIAKAIKQRGMLKVRPQDLSLWKEVGRGQLFREGDVVATEGGAKAIIAFKSGRKLELDEHTMTELHAKGDESDAMVITLLKGSIKAVPTPKLAKDRKKSKKKESLKIKSGDLEIGLDSKDAGVLLTKQVGVDAPEVEVVSGEVKVKDIVSNTSTKVDKTSAPMMFLPSKDKQPEVIWPKQSNVWSFKRSMPRFLPIRVQIRSFSRDSEQNWVIKQLGQDPGKSILIPSKKGIQTINIPMVKSGASVRLHFGIKKKNKYKFSQVHHNFQIMSFGHRRGGVRLTIDGLRFQEGSSEWVEQSLVKNSELTLLLANSRDLLRVRSLLIGSDGFSVASSSMEYSRGVYLYREGRIIGKIKGRISRSNMRRLKKRLNADFVVRTSSSPKSNQSIDNNSPLVIVRDKETTEITRKLIDFHPKIKEFVLNNAEEGTIFNQEVEIIE